MAARRAVQAKTLASQANLSSSQHSLAVTRSSNARLKSTSMTNLAQQQTGSSTINKTASRSALDSIHKGMNAKFTHVQSKVLLQNIRPQAASATTTTSTSSKIPATPTRRKATPTFNSNNNKSTPQQNDRSQLINRIKGLQEELERQSEARDELRAEVERERQDKHDQVAQAKLELQEKAAESERQSEDYHRKLLEAYELADQNRRAADSVLSESRQREEELRKRIEELEGQLSELKEFVAQKEEMMGKMGELREQIAHERERYEEKTRTLNQLFEKEKISDHMRVDQKSNYFKRAKGSLESSESIHQLADSTLVMAANQHNAGQQSYARSEHDMLYGSKLSTRMQDGARNAWKKSRKFASSLVTGSLGGLSACRRHQMGGGARSRKTQQQVNENFVQQAGCSAAAAAETITQQPAEQHTSVVEVGVTVGEFMQQQQASQSTNEQVDELSQQDEQQKQQQQKESLIRVDENNKLTIVTKFNDCQPPAQSASSVSSGGSGVDRCESSSSGRGTASCDSSSDSATGSQNGDEPTTGQKSVESSTDFQQQQRHKRNSSLAFVKVNADGSTFKSFFASDRKSSDSAAAAAKSYDEQSVPRLSSFATNKTSVDLDANQNERVIELAH